MTADQLSINFGAQRRDRGIAQVLSAFAHEQLRTAIVRAACKGCDFTSEDVLLLLPESVITSLHLHPNALGAAIYTAARRHVIVATGAVRHATRPEARKRKLTVWRLK